MSLVNLAGTARVKSRAFMPGSFNPAIPSTAPVVASVATPTAVAAAAPVASNDAPAALNLSADRASVLAAYRAALSDRAVLETKVAEIAAPFEARKTVIDNERDEATKEARDQWAEAGDRVNALGNKVIAAFRTLDGGGTESVECGGVKVKTAATEERKIDADGAAALKEILPVPLFERIVRWKPEVDAEQMKYCRDNEPEWWAKIAPHITIKVKPTTLSIELPKAAKAGR